MTYDIFNKVKTGVFIVVIIILFMYMLIPDMFEKYIMTIIPGYKIYALNSMQFKDAKLNMLLNNANTSIGKLLQSNTGMSQSKIFVINEIKELTKSIERNVLTGLNKMCEYSTTKAKLQMFSHESKRNIPSMLHHQINETPKATQIIKNIFDIYSYATLKYFCNGDKFNIKMLEKYLIAMVDDIYSGNSYNKQVSDIAYNFITRKPISYMNL